jgi:hypothetical protein
MTIETVTEITDSTEGISFRGLHHKCIDPNCHVADFIMAVADQDPISMILCHIENLTNRVNTLDSHIEPIIADVKPAMEKLTKSPMFRMMTAGSED